MTTIIVALSVAIIFALGFAALQLKRGGFTALRIYLKHLLKVFIVLLMLVSVVLVCLLSCYAQMCEILKEILSPDSLENIKGVLKSLSGADSAFIALQTLALTSAMISFASCVACVFGTLVVFVFRTFFTVRRVGITEDEREVAVPESKFVKSFLVYSKFNS